MNFKDIFELQQQDIDDDIFDDMSLFEEMLDFVLEINTDCLSKEQSDKLDNILEKIENYDDSEDEDEDKLEEGMPSRKVRRDLKTKRERARKYRKEKHRIKLKAKKYRKSAKGKKMEKKRKRMGKLGKTATGKRKRKYIN